MKKKQIFTLLFLMLIFSAGIYAQYSGGDGFSGDPYQIATTGDLIELRNTSTDWGAHFIQTANIAFNADETQVDWNNDGSPGPAEGFAPIGNNTTAFSGEYDGGGYTIDNLYINRSATNIALFSKTDGATIANIGVTNVDITGNSSVGGLVGSNDNSTVNNSYSTGTVSGGNQYAGGLVGYNANSNVSNSYSTCSVSVSLYYAGGLVGTNISNSTISNSYSTGSVSGDSDVGGLVGYNLSATISNSYSTGSVSGSPSGGLVGSNDGTVNDSFWNVETDGIAGNSSGDTDNGATGKTTAEMKDVATFTDVSTAGLSLAWDFVGTPNDDGSTVDIWDIDDTENENAGYPFLSWQATEVTWTGSADIYWNNANNWSGTLDVPRSSQNVVIPDVTNDPVIGTSVDADCNDLTVETGASLTIQSNSTSTGSLIVDGIVSGNVTVERYIEGHGGDNSTGWHLLSTPVNSFAISGSAFEPGTNDDFYKWSESIYKWLNYKAGGFTNMDAGTGYLVSYETNSTKNFTGTLNNSDITHSNLSVSADGNGWHLLGNPFPSALHWEYDADWSISNIAPGAKIMSPGGSYTDISAGGANQYIPAHQGFFVQATTDGSNSITIPRADRAHDATSFYKSEVNNLLTLKASQGNKYVETWLQMKDGATVNYDEEYDIHFLGGMEDTPYLYSLCDNDEYVSTNRIPEDINDTEIPLGFSVTNDGEITLEWKNLDSFENDVELSLTDLKTEKTISLDETDSYTFTASTGDDVNRFMLNFKSTVGLDEQSNELEGVSIYSHNSRIFVNSGIELTNAELSVYNSLGQLVSRESYESGDKVISIDQRGAFIVRIQADEGIATEKVIIQ